MSDNMRQKLIILEKADDKERRGTVWANLWTFIDRQLFQELEDEGLLSKDKPGELRYQGAGPAHSITAKGRRFLAMNGGIALLDESRADLQSDADKLSERIRELNRLAV